MELKKIFYLNQEEEAIEFSEYLIKILKEEIKQSDDYELQQYIDFFNQNPFNCTFFCRREPNHVEIGFEYKEPDVLDLFPDWGSAN